MQKGQLKKWNDEKGFGFIRPENSDEEIFFHISALQRSTRRPVAGDNMLFNTVTDEKGRRKAVNASIEGVKSVFTERSFGKSDAMSHQNKHSRSYVIRPRRYTSRHKSNRTVSGLGIIMLVIAVAFGIEQLNKRNFFSNAPVPVVEAVDAEAANIGSRFQCEGKTRCSQMTSCEEAMFYLNNCPGSVTDGDGDGRPCEDQWCGY